MAEPIRQCLHCGVDFEPPWNYKKKVFCSRKCAIRNRMPTPARTDTTFACAHCGKVRERPRHITKKGYVLGYNWRIKFCSKECGWKGRKERPINPNGYVCQSNGYLRVSKRGTGGRVKLLLHRVVMAQKLGRELLPGENVHHLDGNRTNASPENLELWTTRQPCGQRVTDKIAFAIEMLRLYPEFAREAGVMLVDLEHPTDGTPEPAATGNPEALH